MSLMTELSASFWKSTEKVQFELSLLAMRCKMTRLVVIDLTKNTYGCFNDSRSISFLNI